MDSILVFDLRRGAFRKWFPAYEDVTFPELTWWNWVADENVHEGFCENASFLFLVALFSTWRIFLESSESRSNSSGIYSCIVIQPPADLSASLNNLLGFWMSQITLSIFLGNPRTEPISSRDFPSSTFASCSRLNSYCCLFPLFWNDKLTSFFSFCFRVCSSLWFFNSLSSAIALIYELNFSSKSVLELGRNAVQIWTTAPLPYLLIPLKAIQVEKISLSDMQNQDCLLAHWLPITNTLFLLNRDNL